MNKFLLLSIIFYDRICQVVSLSTTFHIRFIDGFFSDTEIKRHVEVGETEKTDKNLLVNIQCDVGCVVEKKEQSNTTFCENSSN